MWTDVKVNIVIYIFFYFSELISIFVTICHAATLRTTAAFGYVLRALANVNRHLCVPYPLKLEDSGSLK